MFCRVLFEEHYQLPVNALNPVYDISTVIPTRGEKPDVTGSQIWPIEMLTGQDDKKKKKNPAEEL